MNINAVHGCTSGPHGCVICHPCYPGCGCPTNNQNMIITCSHCWHSGPNKCNIYITNGRHVDEVCCFCGFRNCYTVMYENTSYIPNKKQHGPFINTDINVNW
jgi:hypothetical protein